MCENSMKISVDKLIFSHKLKIHCSSPCGFLCLVKNLESGKECFIKWVLTRVSTRLRTTWNNNFKTFLMACHCDSVSFIRNQIFYLWIFWRANIVSLLRDSAISTNDVLARKNIYEKRCGYAQLNLNPDTLGTIYAMSGISMTFYCFMRQSLL